MSKETQKIWHEENKEYLAEYRRRSYLAAKPSRRKARKKYQHSENGKIKQKEWEVKSKKKYLENPVNRIKSLITAALRRAANGGLPFDPGLKVSLIVDLQHTCPCCGTEFDYSSGCDRRSKFGKGRDRSPSLDRVDNTKGYTADNVVVICTRCNLAKKDSLLAELEKLVVYVKAYSAPEAIDKRLADHKSALAARAAEKSRATELAEQSNEKPFVALTPEERRARKLLANEEHKAWWAAKTPEERKAHGAKALAARTANAEKRDGGR